jgi:hypothetical protein
MKRPSPSRPLLGSCCLLLGICHGGLAVAQEGIPDVVVSPHGNDANPGTLAQPFATLERARDAVRAMKAQGQRERPLVVALRGGTYFLSQTLTFGPDDSGSESAPILYTAWQDESPVISGGVPIDWEVKDDRWVSQLPTAKDGAWSFHRLFIAGEPRQRPRLPKDGYFHIHGELDPTTANQQKGYDRFEYLAGDLNPDWHRLGDVEMLGMQVWTMARLRVANIDPNNRSVSFTGPTAGLPHYQKLAHGARFLIENVREAMEAGNFYLDSGTGELTYQPHPGEQPAPTIAPRLERLVEFRGDPGAQNWVSHITLRGLQFSHSNWQTPPQGYAFPQAEIALDAAISAVGGRHLRFENSTISHTGGYGIWLDRGSKHNAIHHCTLIDLGAGGIKLGTTDAPADDALVASHNEVSDCLIAHGGRLHPAGVGVWVGHSPHNRIEHNEIVDFYYSGINLGWSWGYGRSLSYQNRVAFNHIHQIGQGVLSDMGGIYTLGAGTGNRLTANRIHDIDSFGYGGWGIYFDEGTSGMMADHNLVYRTKSAGFHQHYGRHNTVSNNIFALGREAQWMRTRPEPEHFTLGFTHNIVLWHQAPLWGSNWTGDNFHCTSNLYWRTDGRAVVFPSGGPLSQWQATGQDAHSQVADPQFVDPSNGDFRLAPDSPALAMGIQPFDPDPVGRRTAPPYTGTRPRAFPPPSVPPPMTLHETFESATEGNPVPGAVTYEDSAEATARVTRSVAHSGRQSLRFTDAAGGKAPFNPHTFWQPGYLEGTATATFWLNRGANAVVRHEWRNAASPYRLGPSFSIDAAGTLNAGGKQIAALPADAWIAFEITTSLGESAGGSWQLTVKVPGQPPVHHELTCDAEFRTLEWFGFISDATGPATWYLDDLDLSLNR